MIQVSGTLQFEADAIEIKSIYASGPGGQHINKNRTAIQLRFAIDKAHGLPPAVRERLRTIAGQRVNGNGELVITARRHRSQARNRREALQRLLTLVRCAAEVPEPRLEKLRSRESKAARLEAKRRRGETKRLRGAVQV